MAQVPPEGISADRWELARLRAAETLVGGKWKSAVGRYGVKAQRIRYGFQQGYCDTSGNVAAFVKERGMDTPINELSHWLHSREGYEVEVGPRPTTPDGRIVFKDANDSHWTDAVFYRRVDEGEDGNVYGRYRNDFLSKFEELPSETQAAEEVQPDEAEVPVATAPETVESDADSGASADEPEGSSDQSGVVQVEGDKAD